MSEIIIIVRFFYEYMSLGMIVDGMVAPDRNHIYWTEKEFNVPGLLHLEKGSSLSKQLGDEIVSFYFGDGEISRQTHLKEFYDVSIHSLFLFLFVKIVYVTDYHRQFLSSRDF